MQKRSLRQPGRPATLRSVVLFAALAGSGIADPIRVTPESLGIDAAPLASLDADIASAKFPLVDSLLIMRCGKVVFDRRYPHDYAATYDKEAHTKGPLNARLTGRYNYFDPTWHPYYHGTDEHTMQSVSKTVTSAIIGIAMTRGEFKAPLSTPVLHYFDESKVKNARPASTSNTMHSGICSGRSASTTTTGSGRRSGLSIPRAACTCAPKTWRRSDCYTSTTDAGTGGG